MVCFFFFFLFLTQFFIDCCGVLMNLLSKIHFLLIWLFDVNWQPFHSVVLSAIVLAMRVNEAVSCCVPSNKLNVWTFRQRNDGTNTQTAYTLNGPTKSKPILLMIGTCCPISTFTSQSNTMAKIICLFLTVSRHVPNIIFIKFINILSVVLSTRQ